MSGDTLSDLLRAVRLRGAVFFYVEGSDPWVVETPLSRELIPAILPGVEHLMPFHGVARGSCWTSLAGDESIPLNEGDLVLYPQGHHHVMSSAPGMRVNNVDKSVYFMPRPAQLPFALNLSAQGMTLSTGGSETSQIGNSQISVVCG